MNYIFELVLEFLFEVFFQQFCGFIGKWSWWIGSFGRIRLDSKANGATITGLTMIVALAGLVIWLGLK